MKLKLNKFFGVLCFWFGIVIILNSFNGMTGYVVSSSSNFAGWNLIGLAFIIGGLGLFMAGKKSQIKRLVADVNETRKEEELRQIELTSQFIRSAKNAPAKQLAAALLKIGTGEGREEKLNKTGERSVRATKRDRVIFTYDPMNNIRLVRYDDSHYKGM